MSIAAFFGLYGAGLLTFASPCVLPLLPVYVALLGGTAVSESDEARARVRLRLAGVGFAVGLSLVFVALGMGASAAAHALEAHRRALQIAAGVAMGVFGLFLLGVLKIGALDRDARPLLEKAPAPKGFFGGVLFGAAFGVGWTPCVGPVLAAALTYAAGSSANAWIAGSKLLAYALGLSTPLVAAAFAAPRVLAWARALRSKTPRLQQLMGVALLAVGGLFVFDRVGAVAPQVATTAEAPCASSATACAKVIDAPPSAEALTGKPRLVEFVSKSCTVCAKMSPVVEELARRCGSGDTLLRIAVDDAAGQAMASRYGVRVVPTFVSVDAVGNEVDRLIGEQSAARLAQAMSDVRGEHCPAM